MAGWRNRVPSALVAPVTAIRRGRNTGGTAGRSSGRSTSASTGSFRTENPSVWPPRGFVPGPDRCSRRRRRTVPGLAVQADEVIPAVAAGPSTTSWSDRAANASLKCAPRGADSPTRSPRRAPHPLQTPRQPRNSKIVRPMILRLAAGTAMGPENKLRCIAARSPEPHSSTRASRSAANRPATSSAYSVIRC